MTRFPQLELQPLRVETIPLLWGWMLEYPVSNFDSSGPKSVTELHSFIDDRVLAGVRYTEVCCDGRPVGVVGILRFGRSAELRGICFTREVHGSGIPLDGVARIMKDLFDQGIPAVEAGYFQDNRRVARFLQKIGAKVTGWSEPTTTRETVQSWYIETVRIDAHDFYAKYRASQAHPHASQGLQVAS